MISTFTTPPSLHPSHLPKKSRHFLTSQTRVNGSNFEIAAPSLRPEYRECAATERPHGAVIDRRGWLLLVKIPREIPTTEANVLWRPLEYRDLRRFVRLVEAVGEV